MRLNRGGGVESNVVVPKERFCDFFLSDKRLRAAFTTLFVIYEDILFGAMAAIL